MDRSSLSSCSNIPPVRIFKFCLNWVEMVNCWDNQPADISNIVTNFSFTLTRQDGLAFVFLLPFALHSFGLHKMMLGMWGLTRPIVPWFPKFIGTT